MAEDMGERTEMPTGKRLADARNRGQIAKSTDLSAAVDLIGAIVLLVVLGGWLMSGFAALIRRIVQVETLGDALTIDSLHNAIKWAFGTGVWLMLPFLALMFLIGWLAQFVQVGWLLTTHPLEPKPERLNPVSGIKRLFSLRNLVKTGLSLLKLSLIAAVGALYIRAQMPELLALPAMGLLPAAGLVGKLLLELSIWMLVVMLAVGLADYLYQRWQHVRDLKMTRQEVQDERRGMDGDPEQKARRMRMARDIAMQRIGQNVPTADVIVTNPTHFSVAIKYDQATMRAPRVVAKGADFLAFRIREVAISNGVPIVERPPLARALYFGVDEGHEIPPEMYQAVAEILAYVYRIQDRAA